MITFFAPLMFSIMLSKNIFIILRKLTFFFFFITSYGWKTALWGFSIYQLLGQNLNNTLVSWISLDVSVSW